ncbi:MAG TPA: hypothetical protein VE093_39385 [Polyangiaceae bacterium]|nr:hypothetical protein [Polyangiaceae bacterium]
MSEGKYGAACAKFDESLRIQRGIGALYNAAGCYEKLGHTAKAWRGFRDAASAAAASGDAERAAAAQERADALEPTLMKLSIIVSAGARAITGLELNRDGSPVPREEWGVAVPVDPGNYRVSATAPGRREWNSVVIVREPGQVVAVTVPELTVKESALTSETRGERSPIPVIALTMGAAASVATGIGLNIAANSKAEDALAIRNGLVARNAPLCDAYLPSDHRTRDDCNALRAVLSDHDSFSNIAVVAYVLGGLAATGTAVYAFWPSPKIRRSAVVRLTPVVTGRERGFWLTGTF